MPPRGYPPLGMDINHRGWTLFFYSIFRENNVHGRVWTSTPGGEYPPGGEDIHAQEFFITDCNVNKFLLLPLTQPRAQFPKM